jgi:thioredoxin 1
MKEIVCISTSALVLSLISCCVLAEIQKGHVCYLEDLAVPFEQIIKSHDFIIVDLFAQWCGPCKSLNPILTTIAKDNPDVVVLKVDIEQFDDIRTEYRIKSIPTLLFFKNGNHVGQEVGYLTQETIQSLIYQYLRT